MPRAGESSNRNESGAYISGDVVHLRCITLDDVRNAAERYFREDGLHEALVALSKKQPGSLTHERRIAAELSRLEQERNKLQARVEVLRGPYRQKRQRLRLELKALRHLETKLLNAKLLKLKAGDTDFSVVSRELDQVRNNVRQYSQRLNALRSQSPAALSKTRAVGVLRFKVRGLYTAIQRLNALQRRLGFYRALRAIKTIHDLTDNQAAFVLGHKLINDDREPVVSTLMRMQGERYIHFAIAVANQSKYTIDRASYDYQQRSAELESNGETADNAASYSLNAGTAQEFTVFTPAGMTAPQRQQFEACVAQFAQQSTMQLLAAGGSAIMDANHGRVIVSRGGSHGHQFGMLAAHHNRRFSMPFVLRLKGGLPTAGMLYFYGNRVTVRHAAAVTEELRQQALLAEPQQLRRIADAAPLRCRAVRGPMVGQPQMADVVSMHRPGLTPNPTLARRVNDGGGRVAQPVSAGRQHNTPGPVTGSSVPVGSSRRGGDRFVQLGMFGATRRSVASGGTMITDVEANSQRIVRLCQYIQQRLADTNVCSWDLQSRATGFGYTRGTKVRAALELILHSLGDGDSVFNLANNHNKRTHYLSALSQTRSRFLPMSCVKGRYSDLYTAVVGDPSSYGREDSRDVVASILSDGQLNPNQLSDAAKEAIIKLIGDQRVAPLSPAGALNGYAVQLEQLAGLDVNVNRAWLGSN